GRSQCLDPDAAAGPLPADVRRVQQGCGGHVHLEGGAEEQEAGPTRAASGASEEHAAPRQEAYGAQQLSAQDERRPRDLRGARRRRAPRVRTGESAADGAALFPVLMERLELPFELRQKSRLRARLASGEE